MEKRRKEKEEGRGEGEGEDKNQPYNRRSDVISSQFLKMSIARWVESWFVHGPQNI